MQRVQFKTREGVLVSSSNIDPSYSRNYALRKAAKLGHSSLVEEDSKTGRQYDLTNLLRSKIRARA